MSGPAPRPGRWRRASPTARLHLGVVGGFLVLSLVLWGRVWFGGHAASTMPCPCGDPALTLWWVEWLPWALLHGHNPLYTSALAAGTGGVNTLTNTSVLFPALLVSPVTLLFGAVAGFNVLVTLAPVVSAYCMFLFARRVTRFVPGQVVAGLLWGFSPYVFDNLVVGHLFLVLGFFPPLAAIVVHDVVLDRRRRPVVNGALGGILIVVQFFTGTELLALSAVLGLVGAVLAVVQAPRLVRARARDLGVAVGTAAVLALVLLAYPVWVVVAGPRHIAGPIWPARVLPSGPLSGIVDPGAYTHLPSQALAVAGYFGGQGPDSLYLGWPLVVVLVLSAPLWWRRRLARCAAGTALVGWVLTQGSDVRGWWWPWHVLARVPLLSDAWPARFADLIDGCAGLLLALALDEGWRRIGALVERRWPVPTGAGAPGRRRPGSPGPPTRPAVMASTGVALSVLALLVVLPMAGSESAPLTVQRAVLPAWFTHDARRLPAGTRVLTIPFSPVALASESTAYQAEDGLRFDMVGGWALVPGRGARSALLSPVGGTDKILQDLSLSPELGIATPAPSPRVVSEVRASLRRWGVQVAVVVPPQSTSPFLSYDTGAAVHVLSAVTGTAPSRQDGAWVWDLRSG